MSTWYFFVKLNLIAALGFFGGGRSGRHGACYQILDRNAKRLRKPHGNSGGRHTGAGANVAVDCAHGIFVLK